MLKDKSPRRKMGLTEQRALAGTQSGKLRAYDLWKKRQITQEGYKGIMRLCSKKI